MADAIVGICGGYLSGRAAEAGNPDTYQVIIHAGTGAITGGGSSDAPADVSAETRAALTQTVPLLAFPVSHPAHPARCHVEDGAALSPAALQMIACNATISTMVHDAGGTVLTAGRRTRRAPAALRRAARQQPGRHHRLPRRGYHPVHHHPAALRRAAGPAPGHLDLLRQRQEPSRPPRTRTCSSKLNGEVALTSS